MVMSEIRNDLIPGRGMKKARLCNDHPPANSAPARADKRVIRGLRGARAAAGMDGPGAELGVAERRGGGGGFRTVS